MTQYTTLIISALDDVRDKFPDLTFGELLYTIFRKEHFVNKPDDVKTSWLLQNVDEDIYNSIETILKSEHLEENEE